MMSSIVDLYHPTPIEEAYGIYLLEQEFGLVDGAPDFRVSGRSAVPFLSRSQLSRDVLRHIWSAVDPEGSGSLHVPAQFHVMLRLVALAQAGIVEPALHNAGFQSPAVILHECLIQHGNRTDIPLAMFDGYSIPDANSLRSLYYQKRVQNDPNIPNGLRHSIFDATPTFQHQSHAAPHSESNNQQQAGNGSVGNVAEAAAQSPYFSDVNSAQQSTHNFVSRDNIIATDTSSYTVQQQTGSAIAAQMGPAFGVGVSTTSIEDAFGALVDVQDAPLPSLESETNHPNPASTIGSTASSSHASTPMTDLFAFGPSIMLEGNATANNNHQRLTSESNPISTVNSTSSSMLSTHMADLFEPTSGFGMSVSVAASAFAPNPQPTSSFEDPLASNGTNTLFAPDDLAINSRNVPESLGSEKIRESAFSDPFANVPVGRNGSLGQPYSSGGAVTEDDEDFGDFAAASAPLDLNQTPGVITTAPILTSLDNQDAVNALASGDANIYPSTEMAHPPAHSESLGDVFGDFVGGIDENLVSFHATVTETVASHFHDTIPQQASLVESGDDDDFGDFEGGTEHQQSPAANLDDFKFSSCGSKLNEDSAFTPSVGDAFSAFDALVDVQDKPLPTLRSLSREKDDSLIKSALNGFPDNPPVSVGNEENDPHIIEQLQGYSSVTEDPLDPVEAAEPVASKSSFFAVNTKEETLSDESKASTETQNDQVPIPEDLVDCENVSEARMRDSEVDFCDFVGTGHLDTGNKKPVDFEFHLSTPNDTFHQHESNDMVIPSSVGWGAFDALGSLENEPLPSLSSAMDHHTGYKDDPIVQGHEEKQTTGDIVDVFLSDEVPSDINFESHDNNEPNAASKTERAKDSCVNEIDESESFGDFVGDDTELDVQLPQIIPQENINELQTPLDKPLHMKKVDSTYYSAEVKSSDTDDSDEFAGFEDALESLENCKPVSSFHSADQQIKDTGGAHSEIEHEQSDPCHVFHLDHTKTTKSIVIKESRCDRAQPETLADANANDFDEFGDFESHTLNNTLDHVTEEDFKDHSVVDKINSPGDLQIQVIQNGFAAVDALNDCFERTTQNEKSLAVPELAVNTEPDTEFASFSRIEATQQTPEPEGESMQLSKEMNDDVADQMGDFADPSNHIGFGNINDFGDFEVATPVEPQAKSEETNTEHYENGTKDDDEFGDFASFGPNSGVTETSTDLGVVLSEGHDGGNAFVALETTNNHEEDIDQIKNKMIMLASQLPDVFWRKSSSAKGVVEFSDCFSAHVKAKALNPDLRSRIERSNDLLHALSSTHYKLASIDWLQSLSAIQEELSRGIKIMQEAKHMMQWEIDYVKGTLEMYADGIGELIRLTRSITATIGDLLLLEKSTQLTTDTVTSQWFDMDLVCKALEIETQWMQIAELKVQLQLNSKVSIESLVEIRSSGSVCPEDRCYFTLQPLSSSTMQSTTTAVSWKGNKYMACSANFLASQYASYAK
jgi:hypothetical protein